jgi:hypothetical protein
VGTRPPVRAEAWFAQPALALKTGS